eukprot:TRINITY_DN3664_c0_g1_i1.p1 TRINITY_DN3664_c0_g1~~TRINITY_DN3664_c0_g1_i1.p1  ORF type:complete len:140 (+),score=12.66 TRINITY_DN3664_c0_g1_i1:270-689(+)
MFARSSRPRRPLLVLAPALLLCVWIVVNISGTEAATNVDVISLVGELCHSKCLNVLKDPAICPDFCEFVHHLEVDHHRTVLEDFWTRTTDEHLPFQYAMDSIVRWKVRSKEDNEHHIALEYEKELEKWVRDEESGMDEL